MRTIQLQKILNQERNLFFKLVSPGADLASGKLFSGVWDFEFDSLILLQDTDPNVDNMNGKNSLFLRRISTPLLY